MKTDRLLLGLCSLGCVLPGTKVAAADKKPVQQEEKPNLLIIITDQQRADAIGAAGKFKFLKTPNLDRLSAEGARFTNAYTPCAVSGPGRSCLLTGMLVEHTGVLTNEMVDKDPIANNFTKVPTYDQVLAKNGWEVEYHGSWHGTTMWMDCYKNFPWTRNPKDSLKSILGEGVEFDKIIKEKYGSRPRVKGSFINPTFKTQYMPDSLDSGFIYGFDENGVPKGPYPFIQPHSHGMLLIDDEDSKTAFQARKGMEAIRRYAGSDKPFAITISFQAPHSPMLPTKTYYDMYALEDMPVPASQQDDKETSPYKGLTKWQSPPEYRDPHLIKYMEKAYFGLVSEVDYWLGQILDELEKDGKADNTMIVFMADHGEQLGEHGMMEKNHFYEGSEKVPFIFWYPKMIKPRVVEEYTTTMDLSATIFDYLGVEDKYVRDGRSARSKIEGRYHGKNFTVTEWLYHGIKSPSHMIVMDGWKLMLNYSTESTVMPGLYNLKDDPDEMQNLLFQGRADRKKYIGKAKKLQKTLVKWLRERDSVYASQIEEIKF